MSTIITITINNIVDDSHPLCIIILLLITNNIINIIIIQNCYYSVFIWLVVWNIFYFSICWEESSQLTNIFQRGWNHQPVMLSAYSPLHQRCVVVARQESASEIFSRTWWPSRQGVWVVGFEILLVWWV